MLFYPTEPIILFRYTLRYELPLGYSEKVRSLITHCSTFFQHHMKIRIRKIQSSRGFSLILHFSGKIFQGKTLHIFPYYPYNAIRDGLTSNRYYPKFFVNAHKTQM